MSTVTQKIPRYLGGVSDQPDELKLPGQLREATNVIPDVSQGLLKRAGLKFQRELAAALDEGTGKWFHIHKTNAATGLEQYIGQVSRDGRVRVWDAGTGKRMNVCYTNSFIALGDLDLGRSGFAGFQQRDISTAIEKVCGDDATEGYLVHDKDEDLHVTTINDFTFFTNRTVPVTMSGSITDARPPEAFIEFKQLAGQYTYSVVLSEFDETKTEKKADIISISMDNWGPKVPVTDSTPACGYVEETEFADISNADGTKTGLGFIIKLTCQKVSNPDTGAESSIYAASATLTEGGNGWEPGDKLNVTMNSGQEMILSIDETLVTQVSQDIGTITYKAGTTPPDLQSLADSFVQQIQELNAGFTIQTMGNGIYLTRDTPFNVSGGDPLLLQTVTTSDDGEGGNLTSVNNVADLPLTCKDGYICKVANSFVQEDDYYVRFYGNNGIDGDGYWEECAKPGIDNALNGNTLPHCMLRLADTELDADGDLIVNFLVGPNLWDSRKAGDELTNPRPSFAPQAGFDFGLTINASLWYRDRLVFLSDENIVMSRAGEYFNLFGKSAKTVVDDDPIDVAVSSNRPSVLYEAISQNGGLVLFGENQQYMLFNDSDVLSPQTVKVVALSNYNFNAKTPPISLGTTLGFFSSTGTHTRFFEMVNLTRDTQPDIVEQSKVAGSLIPKDLNLVAESSNNQVVFAAEPGTKDIWSYRYFNTGDKRALSSWYKWEILGDLIYHCIVNDDYYIVSKIDGKVILGSVDLQERRGTKTFTEEEYRIHLDYYVGVAGESMSYNPNADETSFDMPIPYASAGELVVFGLNENEGRYAPAVGLILPEGIVRLHGDWTAGDLAIGYTFPMRIELPQIYLNKTENNTSTSDTRAYLTVSRIKMNFADIGVVTTTLKRLGKPDYVELIESAVQDYYKADSIAFLPARTVTIPVYEKNKNVIIQISSTHPSPAIFNSMEWEGNITQKFYQRV